MARKLAHRNLFHHAPDRADVYQGLQRDFDWDTYIHAFWHLVFVGMATGAVIFANRPDWLWLFGGIYAAERALSRFMDNSNRNWAMHVIDWMEYNRQHLQSPDEPTQREEHSW
jgi:hypothetical protein